MEDGCIAKFWAYGRDLQEESKFKGALKQLLSEFRKSLDNSSPLAKAIDNKESSEKIALLAGKEKYPQLAEILFMDTLEGNKRKEKRRLALGRRLGGRRAGKLDVNPEKRQVPRRSDTRRDSSNERRDD